jgi:hypothetical protein
MAITMLQANWLACIAKSRAGVVRCHTRYKNQKYGTLAGLASLSLFLWCLSPSVLGHAALATRPHSCKDAFANLRPPEKAPESGEGLVGGDMAGARGANKICVPRALCCMADRVVHVDVETPSICKEEASMARVRTHDMDGCS